MASSRTATTGMSSPPVASGSDARGKITSACSGADLSPLVRPAEIEGDRGHGERGQAEEDPGVAQPVVGPDLARDAQNGHHREVGQEPCVVGLPGGVVLHRMVGLDQRVVRILSPDEVLAPDLHRHDLGLQVRTGDAVEAPQDLEPERDGERRRRTRRRPRGRGPARRGGAGAASARCPVAAGGRGAASRPGRPTPAHRTRRATTPCAPTPGTGRWSTCRSCRARRAR